MSSRLLAIALCLLCTTSGLFAAEKTWTGGGGAGVPDWMSATNWNGAVIPSANDSLIFPILTSSTFNKTAVNSFAAGTAFGPIRIDAGGYVLSGNQVDLVGGLFLNGPNSAQVALPLELADPVAFTVSHSLGILTLSQPISGNGGIIKSGNGLLILNNNHSYTGPTIINGGSVQVGGSVPGVIQFNNGFLIGSGSVDGVTSLNQGVASVSPGTSSAVGTLTVDGDLTLFANDSLRFDITGSGVNEADKIVVNGAVNIPIGGDGFYLGIGYNAPVNTDFVLVQNDGTDPVVFDATTPSNYLIPTFVLNNQRFQISMVGAMGSTDRNDVVLRKVGPSEITVNSLVASPSSVAYGNSVTLTATYSGGSIAGIQVSFWDGNEYLGANNIGINTAQISTSALKPGVRKITALFEGNSAFAPRRSSIIDVTVAGVPTSTGLAVVPGPTSDPDELVTMTATVTPLAGSASGSVQFKDGSVVIATEPVSANQAVYTTSALIAGMHSLSAVYVPTGSFEGSTSAAVAHEVDGTATTTTLSSSLNPAVAGDDVTFTATVTGGTPTGSVRFRDGAVTLGTVALSGTTATLTTSGLSAGTHSLTAHYLGSTEEEPSSSSTLSQVITAAPDGSGSGGSGVELEGGGCGLGGGIATLTLALLMLVGLRLRRR